MAARVVIVVEVKSGLLITDCIMETLRRKGRAALYMLNAEASSWANWVEPKGFLLKDIRNCVAPTMPQIAWIDCKELVLETIYNIRKCFVHHDTSRLKYACRQCWTVTRFPTGRPPSRQPELGSSPCAAAHGVCILASPFRKRAC